MTKALDLIGHAFGQLLVTERSASDYLGRSMWVCRCSCGKITVVSGNKLRLGTTHSCGCWKATAFGHRNRKHGASQAGSPEYRAWKGMRDRCNNPNTPQWADYGGRGIKVCERWNEFDAFFADIGPRPSPEHTLDRHPNNDGNYEPGNVRWATRKEQNNNRRGRKRGYKKGPLSSETRAKISASKGTLSAEARKNISEAAKRRAPLSPEARAKISEAAKGRVHSLETRAKISEANKRRWNKNDTSAPRFKPSRNSAEDIRNGHLTIEFDADVPVFREVPRMRT